MRVVDSAWMLCISIKLMYFQARGILLEKIMVCYLTLSLLLAATIMLAADNFCR